MRAPSIRKGFFVATALAGLLYFSAQLQAKQPVLPQHAEAPAGRARHGQLRITKFYDTAAPLSAGKPGQLIRSQPFDEYYLSEGISAVRILYHSVAANGEDVASSGVVLIPDGTPPPGGWPVIAWAHRFICTARSCAPSLMRNLHSGPFLSMYVLLGYAVVATDYVGLGTDFRNAFVDTRSNATDVIDSIPAARAAVPHLSAKWIAMGESEGGTAVLSVAEIESQMDDTSYLGSIAISGAIDMTTYVDHLAQGPWNDTLGSLIYGTKTVFPQFHVEEILTEKGLARYREMNQSGEAPSRAQDPPLGEMLKPSWNRNAFIDQFLAKNTLGLTRARAPLLIIGAEDPLPTAAMAAQVVARMCGRQDQIDFETYPGLDAASVMGGSVEAQIAWIKARFAGGTTRNTCPVR